MVDMLVHQYGLTAKDAITLLSLDDGARLEYYLRVVQMQAEYHAKREEDVPLETIGKMTGNW
jgi:aspartyl-tRNA(Asn)/glutamyl-tRNA(Gln) amidotransferase subunit B